MPHPINNQHTQHVVVVWTLILSLVLFVAFVAEKAKLVIYHVCACPLCSVKQTTLGCEHVAVVCVCVVVAVVVVMCVCVCVCVCVWRGGGEV